MSAPRNPRRGEEHPRAALNEDQVRHIYLSDLPQEFLAKSYGIGIGTVNKIRNNESWTHVTGKLRGYRKT